ncbi:peptidase M16 [Mastigocoleus testarum BC008]|uniref:Peptidase M16 n=2 Tax=Mastigocoleus TaxID=996924 RepID=A0A0V7ZUX9_9CYAN|nr:peptidase M16 [Mastigocoleus testarum BC008]KST68454.1 peptidase M16 [Mastigocoleus testarum BC008]
MERKIKLLGEKTESVSTDVNESVIARGIKTNAPKVRKTILKNGLTVLTKEVKTAPVVTVQIWYGVGSYDEAEGENGIAHLLEHMLFGGTKERPIQFGHLFNALGSDINAFTTYNTTAYYNTVERNKLQALLTLEADRMQNALISPEKLEVEKQVVVSEIQGNENSPEYRLNRAVMQAAFPNSPYGLTVVGTENDIENFTVEQVERFYHKYYKPDNATLIIVGDFETESTLQDIKKIFGKIPKGNSSVAITQNSGSRPITTSNVKSPIILKEPGSLPILQAVYPLPNAKHPDVPALRLLDIILAFGRTARLYKPLVKSGMVSGISGIPANMKFQSWYTLRATAIRGQELTKINETIQQTIAKLITKGVTQEELKRAKKLVRANVFLGKRNISNQAQQLGYDTITTGNYKFTESLLRDIENVTASDIQRVAKIYLDPNKMTLGFFEPTQLDPKAITNNQPIDTTQTSSTNQQLNLNTPVDPDLVAKYLPPIPKPTKQAKQNSPEKIVLSNGLQVLLLPDSSTPTVSLSGHINAGDKFDTREKAGLAELTTVNMISGTKTKNTLNIDKILQEGSIGLSFASNLEGVRIRGIGLAEELPTMVEILADIIKNPTFPKKQLETSRQRQLDRLKAVMNDPIGLGERVFQQTIYPPNHPFSNLATPESISGIQRQDLLNFHQTHYRPDATVLTFVGDFELQQIERLLQEKLGNWNVTGKSPKLTVPEVPLAQKITRKNLDMLGITQSITYMGYIGIDRKDPRFYAAQVLNNILGGNTITSRLGSEIRNRQGLTYGIRSSLEGGKYAKPFMIAMQTNPENVRKAIDSTLKILQQVRDRGVTENEVQTAKQFLTSRYTINLANPDFLSNQILSNEVLGLSPAELEEYSEKIEAVTLTQVNQVAKELLHPDKVTIVTAGPPRNRAKN